MQDNSYNNALLTGKVCRLCLKKADVHSPGIKPRLDAMNEKISILVKKSGKTKKTLEFVSPTYRRLKAELENIKQDARRLWDIHENTVHMALIENRTSTKSDIYDTYWSYDRIKGRGCWTERLVLASGPDGKPDIETVYHPIHSKCIDCGLYVSVNEEDNADILHQRCVECFCTYTSQPFFDWKGDWMEAKI